MILLYKTETRAVRKKAVFDFSNEIRVCQAAKKRG